MILTFADKKLEKMAADYDLCCRKMGSLRAKILFQRIYTLNRVNSWEDLQHLPGRVHQLSGDRKGQWAMDLDHPYRLIFRPAENQVSIHEHGRYKLSKISSVEILEITDYH